ncbi:MAG TPA: hypothetical protein VGM15_03340 [Burkholderiaceae bacterium]|jgi:hypothetical protein
MNAPAGTELTPPTTRRRGRPPRTAPQGRKDAEGQEKVITLDPLREKIDYLVGLKREAESAAEIYAEGVKTVAEQAGLLSATVNKFVGARLKNFDEKRRMCAQLEMCFEEIGG